MNTSCKWGYPDLTDADFVYRALLGHGMFPSLIPPCFTSKGLLRWHQSQSCSLSDIEKPTPRLPVQYFASRNTNVPRPFSIPCPLPYLYLCEHVRANWKDINKHIGKPKITFSRIHVRKIRSQKTRRLKKRIFEMNHQDYGRWQLEESSIDHLLGCEYVVSADISNCYPSIYSHALAWALRGKRGKPSATEENDWIEELDRHCRYTRGGRTNGIPIGPDTSSILSEILLTQVDLALQEKEFEKVVRRIDDYTFYATDEQEAKRFLRDLNLTLRYYDLSLNEKKTKITPIKSYIERHWPDRLNQFTFAPPYNGKNQLGSPSVEAYINTALRLAGEEKNWATLKYAIKVIAGKPLSTRAQRVYVKRMLGLAIQYPYLLPSLEEYVLQPFFNMGNLAEKEVFQKFVDLLIKKALNEATTDALAFGFYYARKYKLSLNGNPEEGTLNLMDCISMSLAYEYAIFQRKTDVIKKFEKEAEAIWTSSDRYAPHDREAYWLFVYQALNPSKIQEDALLSRLKRDKVKFVCWR